MANNRINNAMGELIGIADVLFATTAASSNSPNQLTGSITLNLGYAESGEVVSSDAELWCSPGIISVPALPDKTDNNTDAAQVMYLNQTDHNIVFAVRDTRSQSIAGNINPGETCVYAPVGQGRALFKTDGSVSLMTTTDNTSAGDAVSLTVSPTNGFQFQAPWGKMTFDQTGFHVATSSGARIDMSAVAAPGPLSALVGSNITMSASVVNVNSSNVNLGPLTGILLPAIYGVLPVVAEGIPILAEGVGLVTVNACASTSVNIAV